MIPINSCRVCNSKNIKPFFDLGKQPPANSLLKNLQDDEKFYSLSLSYCSDCGLVQLNETLDPKDLFSQYVWVTNTSKTAREFSEIFYKELASRTENPKDKYVLEIASNDGTFLLPFKRDGFKVLGVDPAQNIAEMAEAAGIPTKCLFFGIDTAKDILKDEGSAQMIFARNVLPHVANTRDFVEGLALLLAENGTLAIEAHYAKIILDELHYDSIYHEHLCYFTFKTLEKLLNEFGLHVFDIKESPISGGSMVVYAKKTKTTEFPAVGFYRERENSEKINEFSRWQEFAEKSVAHRQQLLQILREAKEGGEKIMGYGASARSSTLLNFCGIDSDLLPVIADQNPLKQGLYTAGTHIKIETPENAIAQNPQTVFILAWNFAKEIINTLKQKYNFKGKVIVPLPNDPRVEEI